MPNCDACSSSSACTECAAPYVLNTNNDQCQLCVKGTYFDSGSCLSKRGLIKSKLKFKRLFTTNAWM